MITTQLWEQFNAELKKFICQKVNHQDHCNDILQDVYLKIFINLSKVEKAHNIRAYLYQMANNAVNDYYRNNAIKPAFKDDILTDQSCQMTIPNTEYQLVDCLRTMIDALPEMYKEALIFTELEGLTQKQFAEKVGISLSGAKSRVQRARERLKQEIISCCEYEFDRYGNIVACCKNSPPNKNYCK